MFDDRVRCALDGRAPDEEIVDWEGQVAAASPGLDRAQVAADLADAADSLAVTLDEVNGDEWRFEGLTGRGNPASVAELGTIVVHEGSHHLLDIGRVLRAARGPLTRFLPGLAVEPVVDHQIAGGWAAPKPDRSPCGRLRGQGLLDGGDDLVGGGLGHRVEAGDDLAPGGHEELLEVPADVAGVALGVGTSTSCWYSGWRPSPLTSTFSVSGKVTP